ncbi:MAG: toxic anion resistance protein [Coriobacteriia bacterium]|nr:toxic anion resistance protein [Coriobacteriia bacterium]
MSEMLEFQESSETPESNLHAIEKSVALTPAEQSLVEQRAASIVLNSNEIQAYGASAQGKISASLGRARGKDLGEVGTLISNLMIDLKGFNPNEQPRGIAGLIRKGVISLAKLQAKYATLESSVDKVAEQLKGHSRQLQADNNVLDTMYDNNLDYYQDLTLYILAGKQRLTQADAELKALQAKAETTGNEADIEAAQRLSEAINLLDKRLYDLQLTRVVSMQTAPQLRLIKAGNAAMVAKIESTVTNTIPLWKQGMQIALCLANQAEAIRAQAAVDETTNELLRRNSENLKTGTIAVAKASERGVVDIETLERTQQNILSTLDEVLAIQADGRQKRLEGEAKLQVLEEEMKRKVLEVSGRA